MDIGDLRQNYTKSGLSREDLKDNPFDQFQFWFNQAMEAKIDEPNAMVVATADKNGIPSSRTVLLKAFDKRGFVFYTNYESKKAHDISENPYASLTFLWLGLERQINVIGKVEKVSTTESLKYFLSRPLGSRFGAWTSPQSRIITNRSLLEKKLDEMKRKFSDGKVPLPDFWGGYRVVPSEVEFWQGRPSRLHDRFKYKLIEGEWHVDRYAP
jgi:pyridoxamine 5'-phosphate oxidase